jgi:hypothetical protein
MSTMSRGLKSRISLFVLGADSRIVTFSLLKCLAAPADASPEIKEPKIVASILDSLSPRRESEKGSLIQRRVLRQILHHQEMAHRRKACS